MIKGNLASDVSCSLEFVKNLRKLSGQAQSRAQA